MFALLSNILKIKWVLSSVTILIHLRLFYFSCRVLDARPAADEAVARHLRALKSPRVLRVRYSGRWCRVWLKRVGSRARRLSWSWCWNIGELRVEKDLCRSYVSGHYLQYDNYLLYIRYQIIWEIGAKVCAQFVVAYHCRHACIGMHGTTQPTSQPPQPPYTHNRKHSFAYPSLILNGFIWIYT